MATISDLRNGLAANLQTVKGLRVYATLPDAPNPPSAMISLEKVTYNKAMQKGSAEYGFKIMVILGRVAERVAQQNLDVLVGTGSGSIKVAVESDRTLGGVAFDAFVHELNAYGSVSIGGIDYLSAEFSVQVFAS
jgi:hypothetical protein